jgi:hypothetical protein
MAKTKISEFSSTPGNNTDIDGIDIAEGCAPSNINNAIRELMSQLKNQQAGLDGDTFTVSDVLAVQGVAANAGRVRIGEDSDNGSDYIELRAPASLAANVTFVLPSADGSANAVLATDGSGNLSFSTSTGTGNVVRATSPTLTTPNLGTPSTVTLTNATGLPVSTGISGLGTGVATALAVNVGSSGAFTTFGGAMGTPSSITLTNATGMPLSGVTGLGTNVATALGIAVGSAGAFVTTTGSGASGSWNINAATVTDGVYTSGSYADPAWITSLSTSKLSGSIPISAGGTGQSDKTSAFDALSPTTTKGDIIANSGTSNIRVPVGADGQILVADSTQTSGVKWTTVSGAGTVTSVGITPPAFLTAGAPVTSAGNITLTYSGTAIPISSGGTGLTGLGTAGQVLKVNAGGTALEYGTAISSGDVTGPASSVDNQIVTFSGTTGKSLQAATTTGLLKATSGVIAAAAAGSDYIAPNGALGTPSSANLVNATGYPVASLSGLGTDVATALSNTIGTAGAPVVFGGALGQPLSADLSFAVNLPIASGVSGLGTGIATALTKNTGTAGAPVLFNGALGTPTSGVLTNATGLPLTTGTTGTLPTSKGGTGLTSIGTANQVIRVNSGATALEYATLTAGDVNGPASSTDNAIVRFDSTTGKLLQNSSATITDTGQASFVGYAQVLANTGAGTPGYLELQSNNSGTGTKTLRIQPSAAATTSTQTYTFPTSYGSSGQYLQSDGAGNLTWATVTTGAVTPYSSVNYSGDGTTTTYNTGVTGITVNNVLVLENGVAQLPTTDYTVSGTNVVFTTAPASGVLIQIRYLAGGGSGTVTSIDLSGGTTGLTTSGGPITASGTITLAGTLAAANGGTGQTTYTNGQLLIGNASGGLSKATLTAGSNVTITNGDGAITIAASGGGSSVSVSDEGTQITSAVTSFNFTGAGVTATASTGAVTVNIPGGGGSGGGLTWQSVQSTGFTAVAGNAYPCNTTSGAFTVTLPASPSAGQQVQLLDYAGTWGINNLTVARNGNNINGATNNSVLTTTRGAVTLTYVDATQGWVGSDAFGVSTLNIPVQFLLVAGGGAGGPSGNSAGGGGGGAGGLIESSFGAGSGQTYTITVGAGGTSTSSSNTNGSNSVLAANTCIGGGKGGGWPSTPVSASNGGSGGGAGYGNQGTRGLGTAGQGNDGGTGISSGNYPGGGGGGATSIGGNASTNVGGNGGTGYTTSISGSSLSYAGGGGAGVWTGTAGTGGSGVGGNGSNSGAGSAASPANRGGGGGGGTAVGTSPSAGGNGSSGVVILKIPSAYTATFSGGVTSSLSTAVSGYKIYTVTATSTTSETVTFS